MILITTQNFLPDIGGIQIYLTGLADALSTRGHSLNVFCDACADSAEFDRAKPYRIARFGGLRPWQRWRKGRAIVRRLRQGDGDTLIADSWKSLEHLPASMLSKSRVICIAHGAELLARPNSAKWRRIARALAKADIVAANSDFTGELVRPFLSSRSSLRVVLPGVYPPHGAERSVVARGPRAPSRILTIARFDPYKGIDTMLRAVAKLASRHSEIRYDIVGDGNDRERLHALAGALGLNDRVRFWGRVAEEKKAELLRAADIFALPNRSERGEVEGFGIVFVEAGAFALPSVAGKDGGTSSAILDGKTGLIADGEDEQAVAAALSQLLDDADLAGRLGLAGHERFWREFSWDAAIARFESLLADR